MSDKHDVFSGSLGRYLVQTVIGMLCNSVSHTVTAVMLENGVCSKDSSLWYRHSCEVEFLIHNLCLQLS